MTTPPAPSHAPPEVGEHAEEFYRDFWGAGFWATREPNPDERARGETVVDLVGRFAPARSAPLRILDAGCGRGWLTRMLSERGAVRGIDPVGAAVDRARELFPDLPFERTDTTALVAEGRAGTFDVVVSSEVIEHVPADAKAAFLRSFHDLLAPGGLAVLTTPRGEWYEWCRRHGGGQQPVEVWLTEAQLAALARECGFEVLAQDRVFVPYYPFSVAAKVARTRAFAALLRATRLRALERWQRRQGIYQVIALRRP